MMIGRVVEYVTELVLVLNHKIWQHHDHNIELERVYDRLWREADGWCVENLTGETIYRPYSMDRVWL